MLHNDLLRDATMGQTIFLLSAFHKYATTTRRTAFLVHKDQMVRWSGPCVLIEPVYPKPGNRRGPVGLEHLLRLCLPQHWLNPSDPAVDDGLYESISTRQFPGINLGRRPVPM